MQLRTRPAATLAALALLASTASFAAASDAEERITGVVVDTTGGPGPNSSRIDIHVDRWSSDEEVARLAGVLKEKGLDALQKELEDLDNGWIRIGGSLGYPIAIARSIPKEGGGRTLRVVLDRPLTFLEVARSLRSEDYPLSVIEIEFDAEGNGEGTLAAAVQARFEGPKLVIESYGVRPARILKARAR